MSSLTVIRNSIRARFGFELITEPTNNASAVEEEEKENKGNTDHYGDTLVVRWLNHARSVLIDRGIEGNISVGSSSYAIFNEELSCEVSSKSTRAQESSFTTGESEGVLLQDSNNFGDRETEEYYYLAPVERDQTFSLIDKGIDSLQRRAQQFQRLHYKADIKLSTGVHLTVGLSSYHVYITATVVSLLESFTRGQR